MIKAKQLLKRSLGSFTLLCLLSLAALAQSLGVVQESTLRLISNGETVLEAAALPEADLFRLKEWLNSADSSKVVRNGASISCGPVTLTITSEIAKRWASEPAVLAGTFTERLKNSLASNAPLSWGRSEQVVPVGESREISMKLPAGVSLNVYSNDPEVVEVTPLGPGRYRLTGKTRGISRLVTSASNGRAIPDLPVKVQPWAARWENGPGQFEFTGPVDAKRVQVALERWLSARALPGVQVSASNKGAKDGVWQFQAVAKGAGAITVDQPLQVAVKETPAQIMKPAEVVMLSNHPEKIFGEGILYQRQATATSYRLMWHHRNDPDGPERYVVISLSNPNPAPRKLRLVWSSYGPSPDEIHVGHTAALTYSSAGLAGLGETITLPANGTRTIEIRRVKSGQTMSGVAYLSDLAGARLPLGLTVASTLPMEPVPTARVESRDPGRTASGVFPAQIEMDASHTLGGPYTFLEYGNEPYVKDLEQAHPSYGNFGTMYRTRLLLHNPSDSPKEAFFGFSAPGGAARGVLLLDGVLYDLPMGRSGDGVPVGSIWLEPGQSRQVDLELFPQAGSNYPVRLVVRSNFERREKMELTPSQPHETLIP